MISDEFLKLLESASYLVTVIGLPVAVFALWRDARAERDNERKEIEQRDEETYLRHGSPIGPYLTCLRGRRFEQEHHDWCVRAAALLRDRATRNGDPAPTSDQSR